LQKISWKPKHSEKSRQKATWIRREKFAVEEKMDDGNGRQIEIYI
jgi:hypothetical protein